MGGVRALLHASTRITLGVALALASTPALAAAGVAAPLSEETRSRVEGLYSAAAEALDDGEPGVAAASYAEVLEVIPEDSETHGGRALALADALAAYRAAYAESSAQEHLCAAQALLAAYTEGLADRYGDSAAQLDGAALAAQEGESLAAVLADDNVSCETDHPESASAPEVGPEPAPEVDFERAGERSAPSPWIIGGSVGIGVGGALLGVMAGGLVAGARASRDVQALREGMPSLTVDDPEFDEVLRRGQRSDRLATIAGVGAGVALVAGAILLGLAHSRTPRRAVAGESGARRLELGRGFVVRFGPPRRLQSPRR